MGFFEGLQKLIQGKPVFEPEQKDVPKSTDQDVEVAKFAPKSIPKIQIERTHAHNNGHHMEVRCDFKNESSQYIEIDKIFILGVKREIDVHLRPHEAREAVVYSGPRPKKTNYSNADINYKNEHADYFQIKCRVEFKAESDKTYSVYRITQSGPVKDIQ